MANWRCVELVSYKEGRNHLGDVVQTEVHTDVSLNMDNWDIMQPTGKYVLITRHDIGQTRKLVFENKDTAWYFVRSINR